MALLETVESDYRLRQAEIAEGPAVHVLRGRVTVDDEPIRWSVEVPTGPLVFDGLVHFMSGYGGVTQTSVAPTHALGEMGVPALRSRPARGDYLDLWGSARDPQDLHARVQRTIAADLRSADVQERLRRLPNGREIDVDKKVVVGHSMASLSSTRYAEMEPQFVKLLIKEMGVGYGSPTLALLAKRFLPGLAASYIHELAPAHHHGDIRMDVRNLLAIVHYYSRVRAIFEARSCIREDIRDREKPLRETIPVGYIAARHDILVPPLDSMEQDVDDFVMLENAGHVAPQCKPFMVADEVVAMMRRVKVCS